MGTNENSKFTEKNLEWRQNLGDQVATGYWFCFRLANHSNGKYHKSQREPKFTEKNLKWRQNVSDRVSTGYWFCF